MPLQVIILVGNVGSGKSTLAESLMNHTRINQDILKSRQECIKHAKNALDKNENVVIDRTNINRRQRKYWIDLAKNYKAEVLCINLTIDIETCFNRIKSRTEHPNLSNKESDEKIRSVLNSFAKSYEAPELNEGITKLIDCNDANFLKGAF